MVFFLIFKLLLYINAGCTLFLLYYDVINCSVQIILFCIALVIMINLEIIVS